MLRNEKPRKDYRRNTGEAVEYLDVDPRLLSKLEEFKNHCLGKNYGERAVNSWIAFLQRKHGLFLSNGSRLDVLKLSTGELMEIINQYMPVEHSKRLEREDPHFGGYGRE